MPALIYFIALPFLYLVSVLPFPAMYMLSDFLYVIMYYGLGYRKKVVLTNLKNAFPEKSREEIHRHAKNYYHYLCDLFLETFKTLTISPRKMLRHCALDPEAIACFASLAARRQSFVIAMGHHGNWEWAGNAFSLTCEHQLYVIYHPLRNKYFDGLMHRMRRRFGTGLIARQNTFREMVKNKTALTVTAFIADQSPPKENALWMSFLNQDTAVFTGTEKMAVKMKYPVVYIDVVRKKRGYYTVHATEIRFDPIAETGTLTRIYNEALERDIVRQPETWLWSHRRWKHRRQPEQQQAAAPASDFSA